MGIRSLLMGGRLEEISFKQTPDGWIFQAPSLLTPFGHGTHYLVSDAQKEAIAARLRRIWVWTLVLIVVLAAPAGAIMNNDLRIPLLEGAVAKALVYGGLVVLLACGMVLWQVLAVRPLLAGARPTTERISLADRFRRQAAVTSTAHAIFTTVTLSVLFAFAIMSLIAAESRMELLGWGLCGAVLGGLAFYSWAVLVLKLRRN